MKNSKKIMYVEATQDGTIGGSHYCLLDLILEIDQSKFSPIVIFYENNSLEKEFKDAGAEVIVYHKPHGKNFKKIISESPFKFLSSLN